MEMLTIIQNICSFLWKGRACICAVIVYCLGRKAAKKDDRIKVQDNALQDDQKSFQLMQEMNEAAVKAPSDQSGLMESLKRGEF